MAIGRGQLPSWERFVQGTGQRPLRVCADLSIEAVQVYGGQALESDQIRRCTTFLYKPMRKRELALTEHLLCAPC